MPRSGDRRKQRKAYFCAPSHVRRILMSTRLSRDQRAKYNVRALPIRKDDEVKVKRGIFKGREGKIICVYRKKMVVHVDRITREKANGAVVQIGINASNLEITRPKLDKHRREILERRNKSKAQDGKAGKITEKDVAMQDVD
mmetsp:Transcript_53372/g.73976  ORF Transcript_53372/g.73976 Transcript_53372/m.73976 type:complete len:142 (+) Transcript_53372:126-551(+)